MGKFKVGDFVIAKRGAPYGITCDGTILKIESVETLRNSCFRGIVLSCPISSGYVGRGFSGLEMRFFEPYFDKLN